MSEKSCWLRVTIKTGFSPKDRFVLFDSSGFSRKVGVRVPATEVDEKRSMVRVMLVEMATSQCTVTLPDHGGTYKVARDLVVVSASLRCVTVTGADDSVDPDKLLDLAEKYSLAEFGILVGNNSSVKRFPSFSWICSLQDAIERRKVVPRLSCHLCGHWAAEFLTSIRAMIPFGDKLPWGRVQINTHGEAHPVVLSHLCRTLASIEGASEDKLEVIFQRDGQNDQIFDYLNSLKVNGDRRYNVSALFDVSHGAGILPTEWPPIIPGASCGYAGGLSPDNVASELDKIALAAGDDPFWIDAETRLRSEDADTFDLVKVEQFLAGATARDQLRQLNSFPVE